MAALDAMIYDDKTEIVHKVKAKLFLFCEEEYTVFLVWIYLKKIVSLAILNSYTPVN